MSGCRCYAFIRIFCLEYIFICLRQVKYTKFHVGFHTNIEHIDFLVFCCIQKWKIRRFNLKKKCKKKLQIICMCIVWNVAQTMNQKRGFSPFIDYVWTNEAYIKKRILFRMYHTHKMCIAFVCAGDSQLFLMNVEITLRGHRLQSFFFLSIIPDSKALTRPYNKMELMPYDRS